MTTASRTFDVIVIGSGHAGCEAALAAARAGCRTLVVTPNLDRTGYMPCNPSIGGPGKSHIVAEIDALGGAMARIADQAAMQVRQLNTSKGPAVRAVRAQCDKSLYAMLMKEALETQDRLEMLQDTATGVILEDTSTAGPARVVGITTAIAGAILATSVVVTAGHSSAPAWCPGASSTAGGRGGRPLGHVTGGLAAGRRHWPAVGSRPAPLRASTRERSISRRPSCSRATMRRSGSAERVRSASCNGGAATGYRRHFSRPEPRGGRPQVACYQTATTDAAHRIIRDNIERAPMYNGSI